MRIALVHGKNVFATGVKRYAEALEAGLRAEGEDVMRVDLVRRELRIRDRGYGGFLTFWGERVRPRWIRADVVHALDPAVSTRDTDVVTVHDLITEMRPDWYQRDAITRMDWRMTRRYARRATRFIADSEVTRQEILARWGVEADRVTTVHLGIDHARFRPVERPAPHVAEGRPTLVYIGDDNPRKNLQLAVEAVGALRQRHGIEARLLRIGPTRFPRVHERYRATAKTMGVDLVEPGFVADEDVVAILSRAAAFLWPPVIEGFGLPPLEAMACGCPVVALDTPINREVGGPLAAYHPDEPDAAADAIAMAIGNPPAKETLVAYAAQFTWARTVAATRAVYAQV